MPKLGKAGSLQSRQAIVHSLVHIESWAVDLSWARGHDVLPMTISRFRNGGDNETADLLERVVYSEEITHCAAGVKWFKYLCARSKDPEFTINNKESDDCNEEIIKKFHSVVREHFRGPLKPPFNAEARKAAGFGPQWV